MASRSLDDLDPRVRPLVDKLLAEAEAASIPLTVITTLRSQAEQDHAVAVGRSWTRHSKHLPQPPLGKALAVDVVPTHLMSQPNWAPTDPAWWIVAKIGIGLGLRSGMDWHDQGLPSVGQTRQAWDPGHLEWKG